MEQKVKCYQSYQRERTGFRFQPRSSGELWKSPSARFRRYREHFEGYAENWADPHVLQD